MTIIRFAQPRRLSDIFDDIFSKSMEDIDKKSCDCVPAANIIENENSFEIQMAVPGYSKKDIQIELENNVLSIFNEFEIIQDIPSIYRQKVKKHY